MPNLLPSLDGRELTVDAALKRPTVIRDRIAQLADEQLLAPRFFRPLGARIEGAGLLYSVVKASDFYTSPVERRAPGTEYVAVEGVEPTPKLALVEDHGGFFEITDEQIIRNEVNYLDQQVTQLANTISKRLDTLAMAAVATSDVESIAILGTWSGLVFEGPLDAITPSANRPLGHLSTAQLEADLDELGVRLNLVVTHPQNAHQLRVAYGQDLDAALKSAGLELYANAQIPVNTVYVIEKANVGLVGFEVALTTEVVDIRERRTKRVQSYVVATFGVDRPYAAKKLTLA